MKKLADYLLSPDAWVCVFSILAVVGLFLCAIGFFTQIRPLMVVGLWFISPILIGGVVIVFIVFPVLIVDNRKQHK
ncbi:MAG: hypothetical protein GX621_05125 [Pirellulaceae bacterium]|nr:hypothetical protein [Pirellulaceae bacterium]